MKGMAAEGNFHGFLYAGLMIDKQEQLKGYRRFNCRLKRSELPVMLREVRSGGLCLAACDGKLDEKTSEVGRGTRLAGCGHCRRRLSSASNTGDEIHGLPLEDVADGKKVFHAGTKLSAN